MQLGISSHLLKLITFPLQSLSHPLSWPPSLSVSQMGKLRLWEGMSLHLSYSWQMGDPGLKHRLLVAGRVQVHPLGVLMAQSIGHA